MKGGLRLRRRGDGQIICPEVFLAQGLFERAFGLIWASHIRGASGLWLPRCNAVHTCWMRAPIAVVFLDEGLRVVEVAPRLVPWRLRRCTAATQVIESSPDSPLAGLCPGDELVLESGS